VRTIAWERRMRSEPAAAPETVVAEIGSGALVGFASGGRLRTPHPGFDAELHAIYLLSDVQGRGLGQAYPEVWYRWDDLRVLAA
jgi:hypothetical protein